MNELGWFVVGVLAGWLLGCGSVMLYACRVELWPCAPEEEGEK